jgi:general secretion pathway protein G
MTMKPMPLARRLRAGFTLLEMLMVIALIALLATVGIVALGRLFGQGQESIAKTWVTSTADTALWAYRTAMGRFPSTEQGLRALIQAPENGSARWKGPYFKTTKVPEDPWGKPYLYRFPGTKNPSGYDVYSCGPDGVEGNADDIGNWD